MPRLVSPEAAATVASATPRFMLGYWLLLSMAILVISIASYFLLFLSAIKLNLSILFGWWLLIMFLASALAQIASGIIWLRQDQRTRGGAFLFAGIILSILVLDLAVLYNAFLNYAVRLFQAYGA